MADAEKPRRRARAAAALEEDLSSLAAKRSPEPLPELEERAPRQALMLGGGLLIVGLGIVGTGTDLAGAGAVVALVGLAAIIYGIHAFGRLGGEDLTATSPDAVARSSATVRLVLGVVVAVIGLAVAVAGYLGLAPAGSIETSVIAFVSGGFLALRSTMALAPVKKTRRPA